MQLVQYGRLSPGDDLCPPNIRYPGVSLTSRQGPETRDTEVRPVMSHVVMMIGDAGKVSDTGGHPHSGGEMSRPGELLSPGFPGDPGQWTEGPLPHCQVSVQDGPLIHY